LTHTYSMFISEWLRSCPSPPPGMKQEVQGGKATAGSTATLATATAQVCPLALLQVAYALSVRGGGTPRLLADLSPRAHAKQNGAPELSSRGPA
jgi:hypothetical protein